MQGGREEDPLTPEPPPPPSQSNGSDVRAPALTAPATGRPVPLTPAGGRAAPTLPPSQPSQPTPSTSVGAQPSAAAPTWYRSDQERSKSLRRRANPWHRRLARGVIAASVLMALGAGLYFGAVAVQDYLERDRLPSAGTEVPAIRDTSFLVRSRAPGPIVDGTLTIDAVSMAFRFVGRNDGPHSGIEVVGPNSSETYIRRSQGDWELMAATNPAPDQLRRDDLVQVVRYLSNDDNADAILTDRVRRGYVDLVELTTEGIGDNEFTSYTLEIDTLGLSVDHPLDWQAFLDDAIPGAAKVPALTVRIWLDADGVLVRVRDDESNWSWERLAYSGNPFVPEDPAALLLQATTGADTGAGAEAVVTTTTVGG